MGGVLVDLVTLLVELGFRQLTIYFLNQEDRLFLEVLLQCFVKEPFQFESWIVQLLFTRLQLSLDNDVIRDVS